MTADHPSSTSPVYDKPSTTASTAGESDRNFRDEYVAATGGAKALTIRRDRIIAEIKRSGFRGRGGGGFSTGVKWASVAHDPYPTK